MQTQELTERVDELLEAQRLVEEAFDLVQRSVSGTTEQAHADAYLLETFRTLLGGSRYEQGLPQLLESFRGGEVKLQVFDQ